MSLLGKILIALNLLAGGAFLFLGLKDYQIRQAWSFAVYRQELAINGMPVDDEDRDERGRQKILDLSDVLATELSGRADVKTQEKALEARRQEVLQRIEDPSIRGPVFNSDRKEFKLLEVLLALAPTVGERNTLRARLVQGNAEQTYSELLSQFDGAFAQVRQIRERELKREAIARLYGVLLEVLPTEEEKTAAKDANYDPTGQPAYRRALNVCGVAALADALSTQARNLLEMNTQVEAARNQSRRLFADQHDALLQDLENRYHDLNRAQDLLNAKLTEVNRQRQLAAAQKVLVKDLTEKLAQEHELTTKELDKLTQQQQELFNVTVLLRDANRLNQQMEARVRQLEQKQR